MYIYIIRTYNNITYRYRLLLLPCKEINVGILKIKKKKLKSTAAPFTASRGIKSHRIIRYTSVFGSESQPRVFLSRRRRYCTFFFFSLNISFCNDIKYNIIQIQLLDVHAFVIVTSTCTVKRNYFEHCNVVFSYYNSLR